MYDVLQMCYCEHNANVHKTYTAIYVHNVVQVRDVGPHESYLVFTATQWKLRLLSLCVNLCNK